MNKPTVVLVAHGVHDHGGMERSFYELVRLTHDRYRYVVVSAELAPELRPFVDWRRIRVPMRPIPLKIVAFAAMAGLTVRRVQADAIHTMGAIILNRTDGATVQFCSAGYIHATGRYAPASAPPLRRLNTTLARTLGLWLERWAYRPGRVRAFAAVSRTVARELEAHYPGIPIELTPNAADMTRFKPDADARLTVRAELGANDDTFVCAFVGGDWDRKGLFEAIAGLIIAAPQVRKELALWVVGRGEARRFDQPAGIDVRFLGVRDDIERILAGADAFLFPSSYETFCLAAHEAAATGLPVLATRVGGIEELLDAGGGVEVERTPESVAAAVVDVADNPEKLRTLGETGRSYAARFDWRRSSEAVTEIWSRKW